MTINPKWEEIFSSRSWGEIPCIELVRFVMRRWPKEAERQELSVLELGSGPGANVKWLFSKGFKVYAIDGSETAIKKCTPYLYFVNPNPPLVAGGYMGEVGDIAELGRYYARDQFDLVVDVGTFMHQKAEDRKSIVEQVYSILKPGGWFFLSELVSEYCSAYNDSLEVRADLSLVRDEHFQPEIPYHFFSEKELSELFVGWKNLRIDIVTRTYAQQRRFYDRYFVSVQKP